MTQTDPNTTTTDAPATDEPGFIPPQNPDAPAVEDAPATDAPAPEVVGPDETTPDVAPADDTGGYVAVGPGDSIETLLSARFGKELDDYAGSKFDREKEPLDYSAARQERLTAAADRVFNDNLTRGHLQQRHITTVGQSVWIPSAFPDL